MSDKSTRKMIRGYEQTASPTLYLSGQFRAPAENFYDSEFVEFDIDRDDEDIAIVVTDLSTGKQMNSADLYTNKSFKPPIFNEEGAINSWDLIKREFGENPFASISLRANVVSRMLKLMNKLGKKINRTIELQASQVLQTGTITLTDSNGVALYTIDFLPKATHFPTAGTTWGQVGADPMGDLSSLADVNRNDGKIDSDYLIFGQAALRAFLSDAAVQALLDNRRIAKGDVIRTSHRGNGGKFHGTIDIDNNTYEIWSYAGRYKHPQTGASTKYIEDGKVVVKAADSRLDATFGSIPNIGKMLGISGPVSMPEIPSRMMAGGLGLSPHVYLTPDGRTLFGSVGTRALMIPTAIDTFGCLDTGL